MRRKNGQSILEYVIVLTAIVVAIGLGIVTFAKHDNTVGVGRLMDQTGKTITNATGKIADATR